jgi:uncharacterized GH25 family protein
MGDTTLEVIMPARVCLALLAAGLLAGPAPAHYNMLLPEKAAVKKDEAVRFTYQWGHPFEHQLFHAPRPQKVWVRSPAGKVSDLTETLEKISVPGADGKNVTAYQFRFTPAERGDHVFLLDTPPIWMEEEGEFWQDSVKVVLHVQAQKGWEKTVRTGKAFEFEPLTRPYGLLPGMVFQAKVRDPVAFEKKAPTDGPPVFEAREMALLAGAFVEVERYNRIAPKELPPDELITRVVRTDPRGVATTTLTDPGWWALTVAVKAGTLEHKGEQRPVRRRSTLWVFVEDRPASR